MKLMIQYLLLVKKNHFSFLFTENGKGAWVSWKPQHAAGNGYHKGLEESAFICHAAVFVLRSGSCKLTRWRFFLSFPLVICFFSKGFQKCVISRRKTLSALVMATTIWKTTASMVRNLTTSPNNHNFNDQNWIGLLPTCLLIALHDSWT